MRLDVRVPVGLMFTVMGLLLVGYGLAGDPAIYAQSLGLNINAIWGGVMLSTGVILLVLARANRHEPTSRDADDRR